VSVPPAHGTVSDRAILALALPALGALAADPLLSLVDTYFVGRLGAVPLAAMGVDAAIFSFAFAAFNFLAYATTPLVARARGSGDPARSGAVVSQALTLAGLIGVGSMALLAAAAPTLVRLMQAAPEVVDPAVSYLRIRALAVPALLVITAGHGAYRGFLDTRTPLLVGVTANLLNAALDPLLMFGAGWGLDGAAVATAVAQWVGAIWFLVLLRRRRQAEGWPSQRPRLRELAEFLAVGTPLALRAVLLVTSLAVATAAAARVGTETVAAHQVVAQVWFLSAMTIDALAIAAQALVAEVVGTGRWAEATALAGRLLRWGVGLGAAIGMGMLALRPVLGGWFSADPAVVAQVRAALPVAALMQPLAAWVFVADGVFMALLRVRRLALSTAGGLAVIVPVLAVSASAGWGLAGVWWAITAMVAARGLVLGSGYRSAFTVSRA
jgi:MATE family multidrug resistance protein